MLLVMENLENQDGSTNDLIRPAEASRISGLTPDGLAKMADRGQISCSRPGGTHRRYFRSEIEALAQPVEAKR